jgi:CRISPR-associated endonuclease/helicase Cas3
VGDWLEMLPWIRGWGADVEVVGPEELREKMLAESRRMAKVYGWDIHRHSEESLTQDDHQFFQDFFGA